MQTHAQIHQQFKQLLAANRPARYILFEIQNLMLTFEPELPIKTTTGHKHECYDTCENLFMSLLELLDANLPKYILEHDESGDLYDLLIETKFTL